jgi:hypothetical protein
MTTDQKTDLGTNLLGFGILWFSSAFLWFVMDSFWPPLGISTLPPLDRPQTIFNIVLRAEFVLSAAFVAVGILLRRRASRKLSLADYVIVVACASIPVLLVFKMAEWTHFPN